MRRYAILLCLFCSGLLPGEPQASKPTAGQQVRSRFAVTRVGANGVVLQPGSVLIVQEDGIKASPAPYHIYWPNNYKKDGRVKQPLVSALPGISRAKAEVRFLQVGEKVYLTNIELKNAEIIFELQSCGACNPSAVNPADVPYRAALAFQVPKGYLEAAEANDVLETIGHVLAIDNSPPPIAAQTPPAPVPDPPPGPTPPSVTVTVKLGDVMDQVVAVMGQPDRVAKVGNKDIYFYKDMKVTFVDGKVSDIQ